MMQKQTMNDMNASRLADAAIAASRQVWLAGLGAAAVTRHWAKTEAGNTLRALIKEGAAVETQTIRVLGSGVQTSLSTASLIWNRARNQVRATVTALADTAVAALPKLKVPAHAGRKMSVAEPRKAAKPPAPKRVKHAARRVTQATRKTR
jgi:hypothetical protein